MAAEAQPVPARRLSNAGSSGSVGVQYCVSDVVNPGCAAIAPSAVRIELVEPENCLPAPGTRSVSTQVDESDITLATRQSDWVELDARYMSSIRGLWEAHNAEIATYKTQLHTERKISRRNISMVKKQYRKKLRQSDRAHRTEVDGLRSGIRKRLRTLEKAADDAREREYRYGLELERHRYGWVLAETRIERLRQALKDIRGEYYASSMDVDEFPSSQLPYNHPTPASPYIPIPSGSYIVNPDDDDVVMTDSTDSDE